MNTPIEEAIESITQLFAVAYIENQQKMWIRVNQHLKSLLPKEKEVIVRAYDSGTGSVIRQLSFLSNDIEIKTGEDYYIQKFNQ